MPGAQALHVFYGTVPLVAAILIGIWSNNKRLDDLNKRIDDQKTSLEKRIDDLKGSLEKRFDDLTVTMITGFSDVKTSINKFETRVSDLEKGLIRS
jgi:polyhydroxyalkanoate synthesis regulator phasin